jgi:hypothetical protein
MCIRDRLKIASTHLVSKSENCRIKEIAGIRYLALDTSDEFKEADLQILSRLSFVFALYELKKQDDQTILIPLKKFNYEYVNDKISSLLKYPGKTNELFTKMMVNVALLSSEFTYDHKIELLDPVAGKGTTLFEGTVYGFNVTGIEIEPKSVHEATIFFKKYIEAERYKHKTDKRQVYGKSKADAVYIQTFEYTHTKEEYKSDNTRRKLAYVTGNGQDASHYFKAHSFNIIVGDLPYGIAHGNTGTKKTNSITRNPSELLELCLPQWYKVLKKGGTIVLAWNAFVVSKTRLTKLFENNGYSVLSYEPYDQFEHLVDKSIKRDIIVAKKT